LPFVGSALVGVCAQLRDFLVLFALMSLSNQRLLLLLLLLL